MLAAGVKARSPPPPSLEASKRGAEVAVTSSAPGGPS